MIYSRTVPRLAYLL